MRNDLRDYSLSVSIYTGTLTAVGRRGGVGLVGTYLRDAAHHSLVDSETLIIILALPLLLRRPHQRFRRPLHSVARRLHTGSRRQPGDSTLSKASVTWQIGHAVSQGTTLSWKLSPHDVVTPSARGEHSHRSFRYMMTWLQL